MVKIIQILRLSRVSTVMLSYIGCHKNKVRKCVVCRLVIYYDILRCS